MRKLGLLGLLYSLFIGPMVFHFGDDAGGGVGDVDIDDAAPAEDSGEEAPAEGSGEEASAEAPAQSSSDLQAQIDELKARENARIEADEQQKKYTNAMESIKSEIPDFDEKLVVSALRELQKTDPDKAEEYNSIAGFKLYWREHSEKIAKSDPTNDGSHSGSGGSRGDLISKVKRGEASVDERASLLEKYL